MKNERNFFNVIVVGGGPAGSTCARDAALLGKSTCLIEMGNPIDKRICPAKQLGIPCVGCKNCSIMSGFGGAGAFSDGKFTMPQKPGDYHIGGDLPFFIGYPETNTLIRDRFITHLVMGAPNNLITEPNKAFIKELDAKLADAGLFRPHADVNHIGTSAIQRLYKKYQDELIDLGVEVLFNTKVVDLCVEGTTVKGVVLADGSKLFADNIVIASGRSGAAWFEKIVEKYDFPRKPALADFGFRIELPSTIMHEINTNLYEAKIMRRFNDMMIRMFCTNPNGAVVTEQTDGIIYVNGHSDDYPLSDKTNFAVLVTTPRFSQADVRAMGEKFNDFGKPVVQRWVDLVDNIPSNRKHIDACNPTLITGTPANMRVLFPKREFKAIEDYMNALNSVIPGLTGPETICYGLEAKFCHPGLDLTEELRVAGWSGIFVIGDAGVTHGLSSAEASGLYAAHLI